MVYQVYVEKKQDYANEASKLLSDIKNFLNINEIENVRVLNRYYLENISQEIFEYAKYNILSEKQLDNVTESLEVDCDNIFAVEFLPGQFDQRANSAVQCIQLVHQTSDILVDTAKVYMLYGKISNDDLSRIKTYLINPVEKRESSLEKPSTIIRKYDKPEKVRILDDFLKLNDDGLKNMLENYSFAMDFYDLKMCQDYFKEEKRNPTITELRVIDTYWSDHCRHTTFNTVIDSVEFDDELLKATYEDYLKTRADLNIKKPITLMDMGTIAAKYLKRNGKLDKLDESDEINACTVKVNIEVNGKNEDYLLLFKNETHNHPTEIEPFGGAATCIGGAIRDPLSGRAYVYAAMRVTGASNPLSDIKDVLPGKLSQRQIITGAASGYSSYGNQIGVATGIVDEIYHDGYTAKHMEIGAVIGSVKAENVVRINPTAGDVVILIGGATGKDGIGGATGSSKSHNQDSVSNSGGEVQKGNAPEERKIQRFFANPVVSKMIKKCNDFGAGGVCVAVGELADGLDIYLDQVPKKYEGLDATELAISESQERMAVVIDKNDLENFIKEAEKENIKAVKVADVKAEPNLTMTWQGDTVVDIKRSFLDTNGASKHTTAVSKLGNIKDNKTNDNFINSYKNVLSDLNVCSNRGLGEMFDSTIGKGTVLMPFGGKYQKTPIQAMVQKIYVQNGETDDCSIMSWGYNPFISEKSPFKGAYLAVVESLCKLVATGTSYKDVYLTFQEYFEKLGENPNSWGKVVSALLGAFKAQKEFGVAAIGGKDSMSGSFEDIHVPPTLVSFAVTTDKAENIITPEFKTSGHQVVYIEVEKDKNGLPDAGKLIQNFNKIHELVKQGKIISMYTTGIYGISQAIYKMCIGNNIGFKFSEEILIDEIFADNYGSFVCEVTQEINLGKVIGTTSKETAIVYKKDILDLSKLSEIYEGKLDSVYSMKSGKKFTEIKDYETGKYEYKKTNIKVAKPTVIIPVFPGTNCETDSAKAVETSGMKADIVVVNNMNPENIKKSIENLASHIKNAQMIFIPGGFSAGDEPDGSGKFITSFMKNEIIKQEVNSLLHNRDGLMLGICNGFQALIKMGVFENGKISEITENSPTLTFNNISRHQSKIVRTKIVSNSSPFLQGVNIGDIISVPISHGEGKFVASEETVKELFSNGQVITQYVDLCGNPTYEEQYNPNGSMYAIEGITSKDGRILGKMGHCERVGKNLYKNVYGNYDIKLFESAFKYFN